MKRNTCSQSFSSQQSYMHRFKSYRFLAGCFITLHLATLTFAAETQTWIVLADKINPRKQPSINATKYKTVLKYHQKIRGKIHPPSKKSKIPWLSFVHREQKMYLPLAMVIPQSGSATTGNLPYGQERIDRDAALALDYKPDDLVKVDPLWDYYTEKRSRYLRPQAARAMQKMFQTAKREGIQLRIVSAYRSASKQRFLYLNKIKKSGLTQKKVAKPGHSEHQLGTTIDICGLDPATVVKASFAKTKEGKWLRLNASRFGFRLSYTPQNSSRTGYDAEPWHFRYIGLAATSKQKP